MMKAAKFPNMAAVPPNENGPRRAWTLPEVRALYDRPLLELVFEAAGVHRRHHDASEVQLCTLLSIKTGGCAEDCAYCPQSAHHNTSVKAQPLMETGAVLDAARAAKAAGSTRFCMGAAWREAGDGPEFERVLDMVRGVRELGLEACCTLGMLTESQARRLAEAGLTAYNHNLDSSESFYGRVIGTRTYKDRLDTIRGVAKAGISRCAAAASSGWARAPRTAWACSRPWPTSTPSPRACRSTPSSRSPRRRWPAARRFTPLTSCARLRRRAS